MQGPKVQTKSGYNGSKKEPRFLRQRDTSVVADGTPGFSSLAPSSGLDSLATAPQTTTAPKLFPLKSYRRAGKSHNKTIIPAKKVQRKRFLGLFCAFFAVFLVLTVLATLVVTLMDNHDSNGGGRSLDEHDSKTSVTTTSLAERTQSNIRSSSTTALSESTSSSLDTKLRQKDKAKGESEQVFFGQNTDNWKKIRLKKSQASHQVNALSSKRHQTKKEATPEIVWLMSFPNSGTSYTLVNIKSMTNCAIGSNYGRNEWGKEHVNRYQNGPYVEREWHLPPTSLLTKTHCGGYKISRGRRTRGSVNNGMFWEDPRDEDFSWACAQGYEPSSSIVIRKAIHLIRNPFDNLVSRMHNRINRLTRNLGQLGRDKIQKQFSDSRQGFLNYCRTFIDEKLDITKKKRSIALPCASEWYRYVVWHNRALELFQRDAARQVPVPSSHTHIQQVHRVYYESYTTDFNATVTGLLDFLNLSATAAAAMNDGKGQIVPFEGATRTYLQFYTKTEFDQAKRLVQAWATPECWKVIRHYFEEPKSVA
ncbi:hypothetical protein ACA910_001857 [Epithemia clementina (nom. ined.)]